MERREVYATTGPRIRLRFFGGWDFDDSDAAAPRSRSDRLRARACRWAADLTPRPRAPRRRASSSMPCAIRSGANLDRIQIVKGWLDAAGEPQERVYDVAWSDGPRARVRTASCRRSATPSISRSRAGPTRSAPPSSARSGPTPSSIPSLARVLLRARHRDSDPALDRLRRGQVQSGPAARSAAQEPGARLHLADLVHAGGLSRGRCTTDRCLDLDCSGISCDAGRCASHNRPRHDRPGEGEVLTGRYDVVRFLVVGGQHNEGKMRAG